MGENLMFYIGKCYVVLNTTLRGVFICVGNIVNDNI